MGNEGISQEQLCIELKESACTSRCYGCTLSTIHHCLTVLRALALVSGTQQVMLRQVGVIKEYLNEVLKSWF